MFKTATVLVSLTACAFVAACASPQPAQYSGLSSAASLRPNPQDDADHVPYRFSSGANWAAYSKVMLEPVSTYQGADNQFGDMSEADKATLAKYMQAQFGEVLSKRFTLTNTPGADTLRVKLTLTGADTTGVIGVFAHVDMAGNLYNGIQGVRGKEGLQTGWVMYAVEIRNSASGSLLEAYVEKQYPNAFNIAAAFGSLSAAKTGLDKGADHLIAQMKLR